MRMGRFKRESKFHICPRCGLKSLTTSESCPECGLVFSRLEIATNKDAKKKIARHDKDFIIWTNKLPSDISRLKLLLLTIFTGVFGGHCFYVGRYWRGGLLLLNFVALVMFVVFNAQLIAFDEGKLLASLTTISGLIALVWVFDVVWVILKRFKVPIAIDLQGEENNNENEGNILVVEEQETVEGDNKPEENKQPIQQQTKPTEENEDENSSRD